MPDSPDTDNKEAPAEVNQIIERFLARHGRQARATVEVAGSHG
jgi:hypothetical protein